MLDPYAITAAAFLVMALFGGHAVADYGLQSAYVAEFKVRSERNPDWFVTLGAHCLIHGFLVLISVVGCAFVLGLIAGQAQVMFTVGPSAVPQIQSGRIRGVAVTTLKRSKSLPDLPTVAESGLPGFEAPAWNGVLVPAGTPPAIIAKLNAEILKNLKQQEFLDKIAVLGFEPVGSTPAEFGDFVKAELAKWAKVAKDSGAKAE